jgi:endonuclease YncB( thermonuclease family)
MGSCLSVDTAQSTTVQTTTATTGGGGAPSHTAVAAGAGTDPHYKTLPNGTQKYKVHHVYDGDTLTLMDERRVRLLGIDTPEMKPPQPFAEEAKAYTKSKCHQKDVWLLSSGEDHYGRTLAHIFVQEPNGTYLCINEGIISKGFGYAYIPNKNEKPFNWDKLIKIQHDARSAKRGVWKSFRDKDVVKTANGSAYHERSCSHISNIRNLQQLKVSAATDMGLHPCRTCMAEA